MRVIGRMEKSMMTLSFTLAMGNISMGNGMTINPMDLMFLESGIRLFLESSIMET